MIQGTTNMLGGFLIVEYPVGTVKAYRNPVYFKKGISSYDGPTATAVSRDIFDAGDLGEFTDEQYEELRRS